MTMDLMLANMTAEIEQRVIAQRAEHAWHRSETRFLYDRARRGPLARFGAIATRIGRLRRGRGRSTPRVAPAGQQRSAGTC